MRSPGAGDAVGRQNSGGSEIDVETNGCLTYAAVGSLALFRLGRGYATRLHAHLQEQRPPGETDARRHQRGHVLAEETSAQVVPCARHASGKLFAVL